MKTFLKKYYFHSKKTNKQTSEWFEATTPSPKSSWWIPTSVIGSKSLVIIIIVCWPVNTNWWWLIAYFQQSTLLIFNLSYIYWLTKQKHLFIVHNFQQQMVLTCCAKFLQYQRLPLIYYNKSHQDQCWPLAHWLILHCPLLYVHWCKSNLIM